MANPTSLTNSNSQSIDTLYGADGTSRVKLSIGDKTLGGGITPHGGWHGAATHQDADTFTANDGVSVIAGVQAGTVTKMLVDASGRPIIVGAAADGAAVAGNPVLIAGQDGANVQTLLTDATGKLVTSGTLVGSVADGAAVAGINPVLIAGQDGTNAQSLLTDTTGRLLVGGELIDNAAFTDGTTRVLPAGFIFDEVAGTSLTENDVGAARMDSKRALVMVLEDKTTRGQRQAVSSSGAALVDNEEMPAAAALADGASNPTATTLGAAQLLFNGTTWDRQLNNAEGTLLASSARTTTTNSPDQTNRNHRGVAVILDATANPGGGETLSLKLQIKDSISGGYVDFADYGVQLTAQNGTKVVILYPGVLGTDLVTGVGKNGPLPRTWRAVVTHSSTGSWTYSLSYSLIV